MLVLCAYLGAMAGITALCYVFRKRPEEVGEGDQRSYDVDEETKPHPAVSDCPDSLGTTPTGEKIRPRGRSPLTPETQAKIQEVLDFVNTPSEQLVLEKSTKKTEKKQPSVPLELPRYGSSNMKKPKEVIDDLKQSKAKVEAWICELDKVINEDSMEPIVRQDRTTRCGSGSGSASGSIKSSSLALSSKTRKTANMERLAKVKEEIEKRHTNLEIKATAAAEHATTKRRDEEDKASTSRRKGPSTGESAGSAVSYSRREVVEVPKRSTAAHETNARTSRSPGRQSSHGSAKTVEDHRPPPPKKTVAATTSKEEKEAASKALRPSRSRAIRRAPAGSHQSRQKEGENEEREATSTTTAGGRTRTTRPEPVRPEPAQRASKTQPGKPASSYETRMKYVPSGRQQRSTSPPSSQHAATETKTRSHAAASKIPLLINSRVRPPTVRTTKGVVAREHKVDPPPPPAVQRPKKSIRITNDPPSRRVELAHPPPPAVVDTQRGQDDDDDGLTLPELNIIDVRGSRSFHPKQESDLHAELHYAAREVAARIAKSGPIGLGKNSSFHRPPSVGSLRGTPGRAIVLPGSTQPVSVSKTVQLPECADDNVTVYFSVTMPRRANSDVNWNGHDDSNHTLTTDCGTESVTTTDLEDMSAAEDDSEDIGCEMQSLSTSSQSYMVNDDGYHSDDGVFPDELTNFPDASDNEGELEYQSSVSGYDAKEFDSCDDQF